MGRIAAALLISSFSAAGVTAASPETMRPMEQAFLDYPLDPDSLFTGFRHGQLPSGQIVSADAQLKSGGREFFFYNPGTRPEIPGLGGVLKPSGRAQVYGDLYRVQTLVVGRPAGKAPEVWTTAVGLGQAVSWGDSGTGPAVPGNTFLGVSVAAAERMPFEKIAKIGAMMPTGTGLFYRHRAGWVPQFFEQAGGVWKEDSVSGSASGRFFEPLLDSRIADPQAHFFQKNYVPAAVLNILNSVQKELKTGAHWSAEAAPSAIALYYKKTNPLQSGGPARQSFQVRTPQGSYYQRQDWQGNIYVRKHENDAGLPAADSPLRLKGQRVLPEGLEKDGADFTRFVAQMRPDLVEIRNAYRWIERTQHLGGDGSGRVIAVESAALFKNGSRLVIHESIRSGRTSRYREIGVQNADLGDSYLRKRNPENERVLRSLAGGVELSLDALRDFHRGAALLQSARTTEALPVSEEMGLFHLRPQNLDSRALREAGAHFKAAARKWQKAFPEMEGHGNANLILPEETEILSARSSLSARLQKNAAHFEDQAHRVRELAFETAVCSGLNGILLEGYSANAELKSQILHHAWQLSESLRHFGRAAEIFGRSPIPYLSAQKNFDAALKQHQKTFFDPEKRARDFFSAVRYDSSGAQGWFVDAVALPWWVRSESKKAEANGDWASAASWTLADQAMRRSPVTGPVYALSGAIADRVADYSRSEADGGSALWGDASAAALLEGIFSLKSGGLGFPASAAAFSRSLESAGARALTASARSAARTVYGPGVLPALAGDWAAAGIMGGGKFLWKERSGGGESVRTAVLIKDWFARQGVTSGVKISLESFSGKWEERLRKNGNDRGVYYLGSLSRKAVPLASEGAAALFWASGGSE